MRAIILPSSRITETCCYLLWHPHLLSPLSVRVRAVSIPQNQELWIGKRYLFWFLFYSNSISKFQYQINGRIQTAEITPWFLLPFKEGKFGTIWALDGSNSNSQTRHVSNSTTNSWSEFMPLMKLGIGIDTAPVRLCGRLLYALTPRDRGHL